VLSGVLNKASCDFHRPFEANAGSSSYLFTVNDFLQSCLTIPRSIATDYMLDGRGSIPGRDFSLLHRVKTGSGTYPIGRTVKLTTHLHLVPRSKMVELYLHSTCLHGVVLDLIKRGGNF
jgi:hypothetical protein